MMRILIPSCLRVRAKAVKRLSSPTRRCTYFESTVRLAMKERVEPKTVPAAQMNQPFMPQTMPAMVRQVEYPITGGKAHSEMAKKRMSQPPGRTRQDSATGPMAARSFGERIRNVMPTAAMRIQAPRNSICCLSDALFHIVSALSWYACSFSTSVGSRPAVELRRRRCDGWERRRFIDGRGGRSAWLFGESGD